MTMKPLLVTYVLTLTLPLILCRVLDAATTKVDFTVNSTIPDSNPTGLADNRIVVSGITELTEVEIHLEISGGWNGDLYAHLVHETGFSVLLNRPGRTEVKDAGSHASGLSVVLSDSAVADIHLADSTGAVIGRFQPDARGIDPLEALDSTPRTEFLSSFQGLPASGEWTLFLADTSGGNVSTLVGWGLTLRGTGTAQSFYDEWAAGLPPGQSSPEDSPQGDGLKNLIKFAFNLDPMEPDVRRLVLGADDEAGLPASQITREDGLVTITLEFLRRRGSALIYTPMRSPDLEPANFVPMNGVETVEIIDDDWERVWLTEALESAAHPRMFCTVEVRFP